MLNAKKAQLTLGLALTLLVAMAMYLAAARVIARGVSQSIKYRLDKLDALFEELQGQLKDDSGLEDYARR